jgi:hypothetical protein
MREEKAGRSRIGAVVGVLVAVAAATVAKVVI